MSPAKRTFSFVPSSEYGKPTSVAVCWNVYTTPDYSGRLGRLGKNDYETRGNLKVWQPSNHPLIFYSDNVGFIRCRTCIFPAFAGKCSLLSPPGLAQAPCYAARRAYLCSTIFPRSATISHSLQVARAVACAPEAFPSGEDRRQVLHDETGLEDMGGQGGGAVQGEAAAGVEHG